MFDRVTHRILYVQPVVKPNDKRRGNPVHDTKQGASVFVSQSFAGEFNQEVEGAAQRSLITRNHVREVQVADEAVCTLRGWRQ